MREPSQPLRRRCLAILATLITLAGAACGEEGRSADLDRADGWQGAVLENPVPKVDFTLSDTEGRPFHFASETEGSLTLLFFGYTNCPDICPIHLASIAAVMRDFPHELRSRVRVVFVSTDPQRDTPERLRTWLDGFDKSFVGLLGTVEQVNAIEQSFGLTPSFVDQAQNPERYLVGHAAQVLAFTTDNLAHIAYPFGTRQSDWAKDLPRLVRGGFGPREAR
ncbi:MAG: SCO family protein [Gemmatimonadota bacterium]|nr:MAG: SCO family protein [Gemmatimonadota bacterium]